MSLRTKFLSVFSLVLGVALFSTAVVAQDTTPAPEKEKKTMKRDRMASKHARGGHMGGKFRFGGMRGIELTDAQKAQIKSIREANRPDPAVRAELKAIHDARKAGQEITADQKARIQAIREQAREKARSVHEQVLNVLTPEQRAQIETRKTEMRERFKNRKFDRPRKPGTSADKPKSI